MTTMLASPADLAVLLDRPETDPGLSLALQRASSAFIGAVGHSVAFIANDTTLIASAGGETIALPARPVTAATVTLAGDAAPLVASSVPGADVVLDRHLGTLTRPGGWPRGLLFVTYSHGYDADEIPGDIQDVVLERAVHIAESLGVYRTTGPITITDAAAGGATQKWVETVDRYLVGIGDRS